MNYRSIAIDGPSGAGKSTIAKILAKKINFNYLDTGAMYRVYTYYYIKNKIDINNEELVNNHLNKINLDIDNGIFYLNGHNVNREIRSDIVTKNVSLISSYKKVRDKLVERQREISEKSNIILDGRDIGTNVLVNADIKFFLTASIEERAKRRYLQLKDNKISLEQVKLDIERRDYLDTNRKISPLQMADDAILIDSSKLSIDETVILLIKKLEENNVI